MLNKPVVEVRDLSVEYERRDRVGRVTGRHSALNSINLLIHPGAAIGLAGVSGCGKSTLVRCLAGWLEPTSGQIIRTGEVQLVMQDPGASLNPRFTAREIIEEPLLIRREAIPAGLATEALARVGIPATRLNDRSSSFSGGERARLAVARTLAAITSPANALLILDESLANLDPETTGILVTLLATLRRDQGLAVLMVSHHLPLLRRTTDTLIILNEGSIAAPDCEFSERLVRAMLQEA